MQRVGAVVRGLGADEPTCTPWLHHWSSPLLCYWNDYSIINIIIQAFKWSIFQKCVFEGSRMLKFESVTASVLHCWCMHGSDKNSSPLRTIVSQVFITRTKIHQVIIGWMNTNKCVKLYSFVGCSTWHSWYDGVTKGVSLCRHVYKF